MHYVLSPRNSSRNEAESSSAEIKMGIIKTSVTNYTANFKLLQSGIV